MNVLLVDDQPAVIESLKREIRWEELGVEKVYTALSAREAKMAMNNFDIDALLTDIEMPEEDGLQLFRWMREHYPQIEGVFITSHADFAYAQEAIRMGGFDYILQPVRGEEVERVLRGVAEKLDRQHEIRRIRSTAALIRSHRSDLLDGLLRKLELGSESAANRAFGEFLQVCRAERGEVDVYPILLEIVDWRRIGHARGEKLLPQLFTNVLEEIFSEEQGQVTLSSLDESRYWMLLALREGARTFDGFRLGMEEFYHFIQTNMEFQVAVYPSSAAGDEDVTAVWQRVTFCANENADKRPGLFWRALEKPGASGDAEIVRQAKAFIARNLNRNVSRADVAREVHLSEEYFSRLFSRYTGFTFKDYVLQEKLNLAKRLLRTSNLSISIVASKAGYDNYSHFSQIFKKHVGLTPQEYRKGNNI